MTEGDMSHCLYHVSLTRTSLMNQWVSAFPQNVERMQDTFANVFLAGLGQRNTTSR